MEKIYEVTVVRQVLVNEKVKTVKQTYLTDAENAGEAEKKVCEHINVEPVAMSAKVKKYEEMVDVRNAHRLYEVNAEASTLNENGKEIKSHETTLAGATTIAEAVSKVADLNEVRMAEYRITSAKETQIIEYII